MISCQCRRTLIFDCELIYQIDLMVELMVFYIRPQSWVMYTQNLIDLGYDGDTQNMTNARINWNRDIYGAALNG